MKNSDFDLHHMHRACQLARRGQGAVEPNPMVGCVIARQAEVMAEGWHQHFGGPHAEIEALQSLAKRIRGKTDLSEATLYVTLEPCCHHGKTPPCTEAILGSGIRRVIVATMDPFPEVAGQGIRQLREAGVSVEVGIGKPEAEALMAPYLKLVRAGRPWIVAKWAMTLDGKLATRSGDSHWISTATARDIAHEIRGRVDGIMVGIGTALADDPRLTARPPGKRVAVRIVLDSNARLPLQSQLVQTPDQAPVLVVVGPRAEPVARQRLRDAGVEVFECVGETHAERLLATLRELGRRRMTNVLVEGGSQLLGAVYDADEIDEVHAFVAPKLVGGKDAPPAFSGSGVSSMRNATQLKNVVIRQIEHDVYLQGRVPREY